MREKELLVVKAGTAVVSNQEKTRLDVNNITNIGRDIFQLGFSQKSEADIVLVSSGAVTAGIQRIDLRGDVLSRQEVDNNIRKKQVAAMIGDPILTRVWSDSVGVPVAADLPTHNDLGRDEHWQSLSNVIFEAIDMNVLPKFNEGDARSTEELESEIITKGIEFKRFADNDPLAAMLAINLSKASYEHYQKTKLIYLTSKPGILEDIEDESSVISDISFDELEKFSSELVNDSESSNGGMDSKIASTLQALKGGVDEVLIGSGIGSQALNNLVKLKAGTRISC